MSDDKKRWYASKYINQITRRNPPTAMELQFPRGDYYDSWQDAHAAVVARCEAEFAKAEKAFQQARTRLMKAKAMTPPPEKAKP